MSRAATGVAEPHSSEPYHLTTGLGQLHWDCLLQFPSFYLLSETERCFILKIDRILFVTSAYGSLLTHLYYLYLETSSFHEGHMFNGRSLKILSDMKIHRKPEYSRLVNAKRGKISLQK